MIYIAHRGLINGPDKEKENHPNTIIEALDSGYHCEVDLFVDGDKIFLGHDCPQYSIDEDFLFCSGLWIHAKNLPALEFLYHTNLNYFWHENDQHTLTSKNFIWTFPGKTLSKYSVMVMPEYVDSSLMITKNAGCYAICSDYITKIKEIRNDG